MDARKDKNAMSAPMPEPHPAASLFPLLEGAEYEAFVEDVRAKGLIEPVWLHKGQLLDGRNRWRACIDADVSVRSREYTGDDPIGFAVSLNVKRRHLTVGQKAALGVEVKALFAVEAAKRKAQAPGRPRGTKSVRADRPGETRSRDQAAKAVGTSGRSVARAARLKEKAPDLYAKVTAGKMALDRAERLERDRDAEAKQVEKARREAAAQEPTTIDLRCGDFRHELADVEGIDAIITDPPYGAEFLPLLDDLRSWADKVLTPDGVLVVLMGQTHLPEVYRRLEGGRPYRWTCCYRTPGPGYVSHDRRVQSNWKPLLVYGGGPRVSDVIDSTGDAKEFHEWGQNYAAFHTLIERFTARGQTVADPFMGAGTTLLAAHALGRHVVGCDIDADHVAKARERINGSPPPAS